MKTTRPYKSRLKINNSYEGQSIEKQVALMLNNKENIGEESPIIYTPRSEGTMAAYNIRSDRFDIALDAIDKMNKSYTARRENKVEMNVVKEEKTAEPSQYKAQIIN